jgi:hypothetical protein
MAKQRGASAQPDEKQQNSPSGKNYFLGIGINEYAHFSKLSNARKDIEDVYQELSQSYDFDAAYAEMLTDSEATRNVILKRIKELRNIVTPEDKVLIYYSGHGFTEDELGYWIPVDAAKGEIGDYISNSEVRELIKVIHAKHILLISDSCFSASLLVRDASRDASSAFDDWERHNSRWVFISGKGVVSDGTKGENSPFAKAIIRQLREAKDHSINIARLADNVITNVRFNYEQQAELSPLFGAGHEGGQFVFRKAGTFTPEVKTQQAPAQTNVYNSTRSAIENVEDTSFLGKLKTMALSSFMMGSLAFKVIVGALAAFMVFFILLVIYFTIFPEKGPPAENPTTTVTDTYNNPTPTAPKEEMKEQPKGIDYTDLNEWNRLNKKGTGAITDYEEYLTKRPNGAFRSAALERITKIREQENVKTAKVQENGKIPIQVKGAAYETEITAIEKMIYEDYEYKKAMIRLEKLGSRYPKDEKIFKLINYCKKYLQAKN